MSTWVMHLRVAERLRPMLGQIDETAYYAGAIAPDSGRMIDDFTYLPSKDVSHWKREDVSYEQRFLDNAEFYHSFCENERDLFKKSLCLGYYVHILTDTIYVRDIIHPFMNAHGRPYWRANITAIRKGWYEIDYRFLENNPCYAPFERLKELKPFDNSFLDYFEKNDIYERIQNAIELYTSAKSDKETVFVTHTPDRAEKLVSAMTSEISAVLKKHGI